MIDSKARWVWIDSKKSDEYCSFTQDFSCDGNKTVLNICAVTNYVAYVNGERVGFGIFAGYTFEKYFDQIDVTAYCKKGKNQLTVTVWNEGVNTSTHIAERGGLIFSIEQGGQTVAFSSQDLTRGGLHGGYIQNRCRRITFQLGYTSGMASDYSIEYGKCVEVDLTYNLKPRPINKLIEGDFVCAKPIFAQDKRIFDLGRETVGYLAVDFECEEDCEIKIAYGEHLKDGQVRYLIDGRDFSLDFACKKGVNKFEQFFVRVAGRYLEVFAPKGVKINRIGIIPVMYPQKEKEGFLTGIDKQIYDVCVRTLRLCMHEHYEDCPWREQALYVLDGRNQMLCGYYAFEDTSFQRANLVFMSKGLREDGLLELTYPAVNTPAIPFFSVMYPVAVFEYVEHTGDETILSEVMPTLLKIMNFFKGKITDNGLIGTLPKPYWNFYEWADSSDGFGENQDKFRFDLILNCAFLYSYERFKKLCDKFGTDFEVDQEKIKNAIEKNFYDEEKGMFFLCNEGEKKYSQLGNAFAKLVGLNGKNLLSAIKGNGVIEATLSMLGYVYDALLMDKSNEDFVLQDIRSKYKMMLDLGATSFWETMLGEADFGGAGSLCHGWSAMPIYYYNKLLRG